MLLEERRNCCSLVRGHSEEVAEPSTAEDDLFTSAFGVVDSRSRIDLSRANCCHEWTSDGESRVESRSVGAGDS